MPNETRVLLDRDDFSDLVSGKIVEKGPVKIALEDIGWPVMLKLIHEALKSRAAEPDVRTRFLKAGLAFPSDDLPPTHTWPSE